MTKLNENFVRKVLFFLVLIIALILICFFNSQSVYASNCGNGNIDPGEQCDGTNLNNETCASLGYVSGNLSCNSDCTFRTDYCNIISDVYDASLIPDCELVNNVSANACHGDEGFPFWHNNKWYFSFSDVYGCSNPWGDWVATNALAWTSDTDYSDCFNLEGWSVDENTGIVKDMIPATGGYKYTPFGGTSIDGRMFRFFAKRHFGEGDPDVHESIIFYSDDNGQTWQESNAKWSGTPKTDSTKMGNANFLPNNVNGYQYVYGTRADMVGIYVARVPYDKDTVLDLEQYEYLSGYDYDENNVPKNPIWSSDINNIIPVAQNLNLWGIEHTAYTISVYYDQNTNKYLMISNELGIALISESPYPWGPFENKRVVIGAEPDAGHKWGYGQTILSLDQNGLMYFSSAFYVPPYNVTIGKATLNYVSVCTSFTYNCSKCQSDNTKTCTVTASFPEGCAGGAPVLTQACSNNVVNADTQDNNDSAGYQMYKKLKRDYHNSESKAKYNEIIKIKKNNSSNYLIMKAIYEKYKKLSSRERRIYLDTTTLEMFNKYKKYKGYKTYKEHKKKYE